MIKLQTNDYVRDKSVFMPPKPVMIELSISTTGLACLISTATLYINYLIDAIKDIWSVNSEKFTKSTYLGLM